VSENLLWTLNEKFSLLVLCALKERSRKRFCLGSSSQFVCRTPIGTAGIYGVENHVSALRVVKSLDKFPGWIVDNCAVVPVPDLQKHMHYEGCFSGSCVGDNLEMLGFRASWNQDARTFFGGKNDPVSFDRLVEFRRGTDNRSA
jgi:hypothetical protein